MAQLNKRKLFRMLHIENIPHVLQYGVTHTLSPNANKNYVPIGDSSLISNRNQFALPNGKKLGDYIPFYFGVRMPMLYVIQNGFNMVKAVSLEQIVYCVTSVQTIIDQGLSFIFTNGHAVDGLTEFFDQKDIGNLDHIIDQKAIMAKYWKDDQDLDLKRRKEAEFLVEPDLPPNTINGWVVYDNHAKSKLNTFGIDEHLIVVKPEFYF